MISNPFGPSPVESVILILNPENDQEEFLKNLKTLLPHLNWQAHLYLLCDDASAQVDAFSHIIRAVSDFLAEQKLANTYVHPLIQMDRFGDHESQAWTRMLSLTQAFQQEAYREQGKERLMILPILEILSGVSDEAILAAARFWKSKVTKPSLYFHRRLGLDPIAELNASELHLGFDPIKELGDAEVRLYLDPSPDPSVSGMVSQFGINHIFEGLLAKVEDETADMLTPCHRHLVIEEADGRVFACFNDWQSGKVLGALSDANVLKDKLFNLPEHDCAGCINRSCFMMDINLDINRRQEEGRQVAFRLGMALSQVGKYEEAALFAEKALDLSVTDADRAAAHLHYGLCCLNLGEMERAQKSLMLGEVCADDPGPFVYHLGRLEFARRNYDAAIGRFHEALASGSPEVPKDDLFFNMAVSYINAEDISAAKGYLDKIQQISPPVRFYQGVCDLGMGRVDQSLARLHQALALGPAPEDLARVLFYIGTALKELGRYDEAIDWLEKAVEADPGEYLNYNLMGFCFYQLKAHERAIDAFHKALEINPASAIDYASIGSNLRELGRLEDAVAMYAMALSIDPDLSFASDNMVRLKAIIAQRLAKGDAEYG